MRTRTVTRSESLGDYALVLLVALLATFSCGQAVAQPMVSVFGMVGVTIGTIFSMLVRNSRRLKNLHSADGYVYVVIGIIAFSSATVLNRIFPDDTFPRELMPSAWLLWMLVLGSFALWTDSTLLFQNIPALAMFGFVGCYDTFREVTILFFIFLIAFATLFARAHARDMQRRAVSSGFFGINNSALGTPDQERQVLRAGPWRWAAGADWALWSALAIVVLSLIGAPAFRQSVAPIRGIASVAAPAAVRQRINSQSGNVAQDAVTVGSGPVNLRNIPKFELKGFQSSEPLRTRTYDQYTGRAWNAVWPPFTSTDVPREAPRDYAVREVLGKQLFIEEQYTVSALVLTPDIPTYGRDAVVATRRPWQYERIDTPRFMRTNMYSDVSVTTRVLPRRPVIGYAPQKATGNEVSALSLLNVTEKVRTWAKEITKDAKNDVEAAEMLKAAISKQIKYNTQVSGVPTGLDVVEYALFTSKEGYCDLFASAMVVTARSIGIPARYAVGFLPDPINNDGNGKQILLESDQHAWAELYFEDLGWITFDATEGATVVDGGGRRDSGNNGAAAWSPLRVVQIFLAVICVGSLAAYFILQRSTPKAVMQKREMDRLFESFTFALWQASGIRRRAGQTSQEYVRAVEDRLGGHGDLARSVANQFDALLYSESAMTDEEFAQTRNSVKELVAAVRKVKPPKVSKQA